MSATATPRARSSISWGLLDQVVSSGATFMFVVVAAHSVTPKELGAIAFVFELYLVGVMMTRGLTGDPLTSRFAGLDRVGLAQPIRSAATAAVMVGAALGVLVAIGAVIAEEPLRQVLVVAAIALPGLTLQDYVRSALIVQGRVRSTFANDTFWAVVQLPAMLIAAQIHPTAATVFGAWAATGALAAVIGLVQLRTSLAGPTVVRGWLSRTRDLWPYYLGDNLLFQASSLLLMVVVAATAGLSAMAGFRVAMTVYAPLSLIGRGVVTVAVALLARRRENPAEVRSQALLISFVLTPLAISWGLLTLLVPTSAGVALFGESWHEAEPVVFLASFVCAAGLFATGVAIGLRALSAGRHALIGRVVVTIGAAIASAIGGYLDQEHGLFLALAIFFPVQAAVWWALLSHAARTKPAPTAA
ncbi:MAG: hypothetical protein L0H31_08695 [Nocardioidaceae bacterium]|nr:hypothetical protein [Nocardioidaceae bacterium]